MTSGAPGTNYGAFLRDGNGNPITFSADCVDSGPGPVQTVYCGTPGVVGIVIDMAGGNDKVTDVYSGAWEHVPEIYADLGAGNDETGSGWTHVPFTLIGG